MKICLQLAWKNFGSKDTIYIIKIKWIATMKNTPKKIKIKLLYDLQRNKLVQKFPQTIKRLLNIPIVARYWFNLNGIFKY